MDKITSDTADPAIFAISEIGVFWLKYQCSPPSKASHDSTVFFYFEVSKSIMERKAKDFDYEELFAQKVDRRKTWRGNFGVVVGLLALCLLLLTPSPLAGVEKFIFRSSRGRRTRTKIASKSAFSWSQITPPRNLNTYHALATFYARG